MKGTFEATIGSNGRGTVRVNGAEVACTSFSVDYSVEGPPRVRVEFYPEQADIKLDDVPLSMKEVPQ